jgi:O-antigen/teichoic acid export membrane protein
LKEYIKKILPKNRFARSVSILAGGTAFSQGLTILASPLLTRLYSPDDFGLLAVYASLLGILGVIASLRYELAIPLPEKDEDAASVVVLCLFIVLGMSALSCVAVFFFKESIVRLMNAPGLGDFLWLLPVGLVLMGIYQIFKYWAIRTKSFAAVAKTNVSQSISKIIIQLAGYGLGPIALLFGQITGQAAGSTSLGMLTFRCRGPVYRMIRIHDVIRAARRYIRFPVYSTWGALCNAAGVQSPPLFFAMLFGTSSAGIYMLSQKVIAMPMIFIGRAIGEVLYSEAVEANREGTLGSLANIHEKLAQIAMPPALILVVIGPDLFAFVFGADWRQAGEFSRWMAIFLYFQFVTSPLSILVAVLERQIQGTVFQSSLMAVQLVGILIGGVYSNLILSVALFSLGSALCYLFFLAWIIKITNNKFYYVWCDFVKSFFWSIVIVSPFFVIFIVGKSIFLWLICLISCGFLFVFRYLFLLKKINDM